MDTAVNLNTTATGTIIQAPVPDRAVTTKVARLESSDGSATLPSDRPFVAQAVAARLENSDYPDPPSDIAPPERTLRPYDVPMLPADPPRSGSPLALMPDTGDTAANSTPIRR